MISGAHMRTELASQPECWERAGEVGSGHPSLPTSGERVLVLGCGTSYYMGAAYASRREALGHGMTDAAVASEWTGDIAGRTYDRVIAISRSGTSIQLLDAIDRITKATPVTAVLGTPGSPLAVRVGNEVIDLSFADEESMVQTRFATTALMTLRAGIDDSIAEDIVAAREALTAGLPTPPDQQLVVLGHGWGASLAQEAALKCREAAAIWAEAYPSGEYRHGPLAVAGPHTLVWGVTPLSNVLVEAIGATGASVEQPATSTPLGELVRLHRLAAEWAQSRGRDPDNPRHLSRSVLNT